MSNQLKSDNSQSILSLSSSIFPNNSTFGYCFGKTRYLILVLSTLCLSLMGSNTLILNFTVICMTKPKEIDKYAQTNVTEVEVPMFTLREQSWLFSATPAGMLIGSMFISYFIKRFGIRNTAVGFGYLSAIATILIPFSTQFHFYYIITLRFLQGVSCSLIYIAMGNIAMGWSPLREMGLFISLLSCTFQINPVITMLLGGLLCESSVGWPAIFYLLGTTTFLTFAIFFCFYKDTPREQKNVGPKELLLICEGKPCKSPSDENLVDKRELKIPYTAIISDKVVLGSLANNAGITLGIVIFLQYGPIYLNKILGLKIQKTGISAAIPFMVAAVFKLSLGLLNDRIVRYVSEKSQVLLFVSLSQYPMVFFFILLVVLPPGNDTIVQLCFIGLMSFGGLWSIGWVKGTNLACQNFAHVIYAWSTFLTSLIILLLPAFVSFLAPDNTKDQWSRIFLTIAFVQLIVTILYYFTYDDKPRPWTSGNYLEERQTLNHDTHEQTSNNSTSSI